MIKKILSITAVACMIAMIAGCGAFGEETSILDCENCQNQLKEEYLLMIDSRCICYECVFEEYEKVSSDEVGKCYKCQAFYSQNDSFGMGLCYDCGRVEVGDCSACGDKTLAWGDGLWFSICAECMGGALDDPDVARALREFLNI